jgi:hypothetical protein
MVVGEGVQRPRPMLIDDQSHGEVGFRPMMVELVIG